MRHRSIRLYELGQILLITLYRTDVLKKKIFQATLNALISHINFSMQNILVYLGTIFPYVSSIMNNFILGWILNYLLQSCIQHGMGSHIGNTLKLTGTLKPLKTFCII